jgi:hypothetical protein
MVENDLSITTQKAKATLVATTGVSVYQQLVVNSKRARVSIVLTVEIHMAA